MDGAWMNRLLAALLIFGLVAFDLLGRAAGQASLGDTTRGYEEALGRLADAALAAHRNRCSPSIESCDVCSFDACNTYRPPATECVNSIYGQPDGCDVDGQVCVLMMPLRLNLVVDHHCDTVSPRIYVVPP